MFERGVRLGDRYLLQERIGAGGMAEVWRAEDTRLGRDVAVKVLRERDEDLALRLRRESRVLAGLNHRGVVAVLDAGEVEGRPFLVLELVSGESLAAALARDGPLPRERVASMAGDLADALAHAHVLGVVHRDVKPSNILLSDDGRTCLVDFGIARSADTTQLTGTGLSVGTAAYLAPEQLDAPDQVGPPADVYALALVLAESLTGRRVFPGPAAAAALARLRTDPPLSDVPDEWSSLLVAMTRRDPARRPEAAAVLPAVPRAGGPDHAGPGAAAAATEPDNRRDRAGVATMVFGVGVGAAGVGPGAAEAAGAATMPATPPSSSSAAAYDPPTEALPLTALDSAGSGSHSRRRLWLVTAGVLALLGVGLGVGLAAGGGDGDGGDGTTTPSTVVSPAVSVTSAPVTAIPATTAPAPPTTATIIPTDPGEERPGPPAPNGDGRPGRGDNGPRGDGPGGDGRGDDDDDDD